MTQANVEQIDYWNSRLADGGPRYVETNFDRIIVEPCNAVTAFVFVALAAYFLVRMWGRFREHPFLCLCLPVLIAGGIGGTVYHALRAHKVFFLLDVIPIGLLIAMGSVYLWIRLKPRIWHLMIVAAIVTTFPALFTFHVESHIAIVAHYMALAALILMPIGIVLVRTNFRHAQLIYLALVCFGFAILFRFLDPVSAPVLSVGTHWLWHLGGAAATGLLAEYFYRIETEAIEPSATASLAPTPSA